MWGPNAVNGVINIITRKAKQAKSVDIHASTGNELRGSGFASWSSAPADRAAVRVWGKLVDREPAFSSAGDYLLNTSIRMRDPRPIDRLESRTASMGMRLDSELSAKDQLTVQLDAYGAGRDEMLGYARLPSGALDIAAGRTSSWGGSTQAKWTRTSSPGNEGTLQFTFDKQSLGYPFIDANLNNLAVDYQRLHQTGETNELYWGGGYQQYWDDTRSTGLLGFRPASDIYRVGNVVVRDEWQPVPGKLLASAGIRVDYSSQTRFEFQPSVRLLYTPSTRQSLWAGASRAARMPNRLDRDLQSDAGVEMFAGLPIKAEVFGSRGILSETELTAETGYRFQSGQRWSVDTAVFWNYYPRLRALRVPQQPEIMFLPQGPFGYLSIATESSAKGRSYGSETSLTWQVSGGWRLSPSYSWLNQREWMPPANTQFSYARLLTSSAPHHQGLVRSQHDLGRRWQLDLMARARSYNNELRLAGLMLADARLAFRPTQDTEFSVTVRNITGRSEFEAFSESAFVAIPLRRTVVFKWTHRL
jgi:iron complex outermembrane receptor protein